MDLKVVLPRVALGYVALIAGTRLYCRLTVGMCKSKKDMTGKVVIVTGANTGIGKETAKDLARRNARVILACRDLKRSQEAADDIIESTGNPNVVVRKLDLSSFKSIRKFAEEIHETEERLDVLVNNAGLGSSTNLLSEDGVHLIMATNHFGHFLLTNLLLDLLKQSAPSRIVHVSSSGHMGAHINLDDLVLQENSSGSLPYYNSKLCNILFSNELARRLEGTGVTSNSLHPGVVRTEILRYSNSLNGDLYKFYFNIWGKSAYEGAQTTIHLCVSDEVEGITGKYFSDCKMTRTKPLAQDKELQKKLWDISEQVTKLHSSSPVLRAHL